MQRTNLGHGREVSQAGEPGFCENLSLSVSVNETQSCRRGHVAPPFASPPRPPLDGITTSIGDESGCCGRGDVAAETVHSAPSNPAIAGYGADAPTTPDGESGPSGPCLDNHAKNSSTSGKTRRSKGRADRYGLRETVWEVTSLGRCARCGRTRISREKDYAVEVREREGERAASFANVQTCGSRWACPVCAAKERQEVADRLAVVAARHRAEGGGLYLWTGTLRHRAGEPLAKLIDGVRDGWSSYVVNGGSWQRARSRYGVQHYFKSLDLTIGPNGWHPHYAVLIFTESPLSDDERDDFGDFLHRRFSRGVEANGCSPPVRRQCPIEDVMSEERLSQYLSDAVMKEKAMSAGLEMTRHDLKNGCDRAGSRYRHYSPFQLLRLMHEWGPQSRGDFPADDRPLVDVWREYEQATHGLHAFDSSPGLWQYAEDLAAGEDEDGEVVDSIDVEAATYWAMANTSGGLIDVLEAAETSREALEARIEHYRRVAWSRSARDVLENACRWGAERGRPPPSGTETGLESC